MVSIGAFWNTITAFMNRVWNLIPAVPDKHAAAFWAILHLIAYVSSVVLFSYGAVYKNYLKKKELSGAAHFVERRDVWFISVGCWVVGGYCLAVIVYVRLLSVQDEQGQKCYTVLHSMDLCIGSSDRGCLRRSVLIQETSGSWLQWYHVGRAFCVLSLHFLIQSLKIWEWSILYWLLHYQ